MNVDIQAVHFNAREELLQFVKDNVAKLQQFYAHITSVDVILKAEKDEKGDNKKVEIKIAVPGKTLFAEDHHDSFEEATTSVCDKLKRQIIKYRDKQYAHH